MKVSIPVVAVFVVSLASSAAAQQPPAAQPAPKAGAAKPPPKAAAKVDIGPVVQKLKSGDEGQIRAALDELRNGAANAGPAVPAVVEVLSKGLTEPLTHQAIDALGEIESPDGSAILAQYANHRIVTLRRAAVKAIARTKGAPAVPTLKKALGDGDAQVRGTAALGLGALKAKDSVPDLFLALDHKVNEAAATIGQLCNAEQCEQLSGKLGKLPFEIMTTGLEQILSRPASETTDDTKIKVLGRIRELGTAEANRFLKDIQQSLPKETSARVKQAIDQAVKATSGGAASGTTPSGGAQ